MLFGQSWVLHEMDPGLKCHGSGFVYMIVTQIFFFFFFIFPVQDTRRLRGWNRETDKAIPMVGIC